MKPVLLSLLAAPCCGVELKFAAMDAAGEVKRVKRELTLSPG